MQSEHCEESSPSYNMYLERQCYDNLEELRALRQNPAILKILSHDMYQLWTQEEG